MGQDSSGATDEAFAFALDDEMRMLGEPVALGSDAYDDIRLAGAKSRVLAVWVTRAGVRAQSLAGPELRRDGEPFTVHEIRQYPDSGVEAELFRDLVAVAAMDGSDVYLAFVDPWASAPAFAPVRIASSRIQDRRPGIAAASAQGFVVVCFAVGSGPYGGGPGAMDGVALQVVGADGTLWGAPVQVVSGERNVGGVDCGWNGRDIVIVWWRAAGDGAWNTIFSQRARPTFL